MSLSEVWCCLVEYVEPLAKALQEAGEAALKFRNPVPGEACVARLPSANGDEEGAGDEAPTPWARAVVRSRPSPAKLELFFVDMGGTRVVHHTEVKQIPAELTTQSGCAFQCVLNCSYPVDPAELSARILYKDLVLQVEQQLEPAKVIGSLFDTSGEDEVNVLDSFAPPPPPAQAAEPPVLEVEPVQDTEPVVEAGADTASPAVESEVVPEVPAEKPQVTAAKAAATVTKPEEATAKPLPPPARTSPPVKSTQPHFRRGPIVPCYPPLSKISGKMLAIVMHVEDLSCFYVMPKDQESAMDDLSERLQTHYEETPEPVVEPLPRLPCVALYQNDNIWYRAKVVPDGSCVQFIDYGNVDIVPEVRAIAAEFLEVPPFCYKCKLGGAKDLADILGVVDMFKNMVSDKPVEVEVVTWGPEVTVRLCIGGEDVGMALKEKFASSRTLESKENGKTEAPAAVTVSCEAGVVSHVDALNSFYVQFSSRLGDLDVLGDKLQDTLASGTATAVEVPDSNTLYAALYTEDSLWYRARVEGTGEDGSGLRVRFVDYGNSQTVESVVPLDSEDLRIEPFCVECRLAGVSAADNASALEKFKELIFESDLLVSTVVPGKPMAVRLFTADGTDLLSQLPLPKRYRTTEVPLHQKVAVQISHVESATNFYVNLGDSLEVLESLAEQLLEVPVNDSMPAVDTSLPCIVYWSDGLPYRITVLKDAVECGAEGPALALVKFVDYGNTDTVDQAGIRVLPDGLVDIPPFAINCTLDVPEGKLGEEATEKLQLLAQSEPATSLLAEFLEQRDSCYVVRLLDMGIDVLERLLQGTEQDASREDASSLVSSDVQSSPVLAETAKVPDTNGASSPSTELIDEGGDLNSTGPAADVPSCSVKEDSAVGNDTEAKKETRVLEEDGLCQGEEPAQLAGMLKDEEKATEPAVNAEQSELKEATTEVVSSDIVTCEDTERNETEHKKVDGSGKDQALLVEEEVLPEEAEQQDSNLPVATEADALSEGQGESASVSALSEDNAHLKETKDRVANLSAVSKDNVLPEEPDHDEADLSVGTEDYAQSEDICEAAVFEGYVLDDNIDSAAVDAPLEDTAGVAVTESAISSADTQYMTSTTEVSEESTEVEENDLKNLVGETADHEASEAKSLASRMDAGFANGHVAAASSVGLCTMPAVSEETTAQGQQAADSTVYSGTLPKSSTSTPEAGDAPSLTQRVGADDSSATGAVATSDFGAGGDAESATVPHSTMAESGRTTPSHRSVRKISLDDRPIPGVCTNAELLGAPSDT